MLLLTSANVVGAVRAIRKSPLLSAVIVLTLAVGIGADVGVFALVNGALFKPRVTYDPDRFVQVTSRSMVATSGTLLTSLQDYRAYRDGSHAFTQLAAWTPVHATLSAPDSGFRAIPLLVTCNFFPVYGPEAPIAGRLFRADECDESRPVPVAVIGEELWRVRLGAAPDVVGSTISLDRHPFTVVGVMPKGYAGHLRSDIWIPYPMAAAFFGGRNLLREPATPWLMTMAGRLRAGATWDGARSELAALAVRQDRLVAERSTTLHLSNGSLIDSDAVQPMTFWIVPLIIGALTLVVLLVCANVTTLLLSRAAARRQEMAIRVSLGGTRTQLLAMLLTESVVLALCAAPLAAAVSYAVPWLFQRQVATPTYPFGADASVWLYLCGTTLLAGLTAGIAPAFESLRRDVAPSLHGYDAPIGRAGGWRARDVLIAAQVALSLVLLVGTGLFVSAETRLANTDAGYEAAHVLLVAPRVRVPPYSPDTAASFYGRLADRTRAIPGVSGVGFAAAPPFGGVDLEQSGHSTFSVTSTAGARVTLTTVNAVSHDYFTVLGIPIVRGAIPDDGVARARVRTVVVSASLARALTPSRDPIGELLHDDAGNSWQIVAVARDIDTPAARGGPDFTMYLQRDADAFGDAMVVRFGGDARAVADAVRRAIGSLDPDAVSEPLTLAALRDDASRRLLRIVQMLLILGAAALLLALMGIYGIVAFAVRRRLREFGIHMALGATRAGIVNLVLSSGLKPIAYGAASGTMLSLIASIALARVFRDAPIPLNPRDPFVYTSVALLLSTAALSAMIGPAVRAAWSDPALVLRQD